MDYVLVLLLVGVVILICVFVGRLSEKLKIPSLVLFIGIGLLFGEDGIGGIAFDNYGFAETACSICLIFIIFYGGFGTNFKAARPVLGQAAVLSFAGTALTAGALGAAVYLVLNGVFGASVGWLESMLIGSVVASTDAASVFNILRSRRLNLKYNTSSLLEMESGSNDPMSYMLTILFASLLSSLGPALVVLLLVDFFLATNLAEVLAVLLATLFLWRFDFLTSTQLLWINLITDSLPVLALGVERTKNAMDRPPVRAEDILSKRALCSIAFYGVVQTALVLAVFVLGIAFWGNAVASTCAFLTLSLLELLHAFNVRSGAFNRTLLITELVGVLSTVLLAALPPLASVFGLTPLSPVQWLLVMAASLCILPAGWIWRRMRRARCFRGRRKRIPVRGSIG